MDPWSKVDYSRHIWEVSMEMEELPKVVPPSGRVPAASPGSPDLETVAAAIQRGDWEKDLYIRGFLHGGNI